MREFYEILDELKKGDYLVLAGSIPDTLSNNIYREIMEYGQGKGIRYVVDATGDLLVNVLPYRPFLIKPNNHEISEIFHKEISSAEDLIFYGKKLQEMGAQNVLISRAGDGAILLTAKGEVLESPAPEGKVVNSVGAGDSMVAGFLAGYADTRDYREAFYQGISAGSATAFHADLATKEEILEVRKQFAK